jgi:hypothetical protein
MIFHRLIGTLGVLGNDLDETVMGHLSHRLLFGTCKPLFFLFMSRFAIIIHKFIYIAILGFVSSPHLVVVDVGTLDVVFVVALIFVSTVSRMLILVFFNQNLISISVSFLPGDCSQDSSASSFLPP